MKTSLAPLTLALGLLALAACGAEKSPRRSAANTGNNNNNNTVTGTPFARMYGGSNYDRAVDVVVDDEGFIYVLGVTSSSDGDLAGTGHVGIENDLWFLKLNPRGDVVWSKIYDQPEWPSGEDGEDLQLLGDADLLVSGSVTSSDDGVLDDDTDGLVLRVSRADGSVAMSAVLSGEDSLGSPNEDDDDTVLQARGTANGGAFSYTVLGSTETHNSGDFGANQNGGTFAVTDGFVAELSESVGGAVLIEQVTMAGGGGPDSFNFFSGAQIVGQTFSDDSGDLEDFAIRGFNDIWLYDGASYATVARLGGNSNDIIYAVDDTAFAGGSRSSDTVLPCNEDDTDVSDVWFGRFDAAAADGMRWGCFGSDFNDKAVAVIDLGDDGLVVVGNGSGTGELAGADNNDAFIAHVANDFGSATFVGFGTPAGDDVAAAAQAPDGSIVVVGHTVGELPDTTAHGGGDVFVIRLSVPTLP